MVLISANMLKLDRSARFTHLQLELAFKWLVLFQDPPSHVGQSMFWPRKQKPKGFGIWLGKDYFTHMAQGTEDTLRCIAHASEITNYQPVSPLPHTRQLLSSPEDLLHSTPQNPVTCRLGKGMSWSIPPPLYLQQPPLLPGSTDCSTSWLHIPPVC